jgi:acyl-CoA reductase-like NAD-dependent aldehyde dehydrogenase
MPPSNDPETTMGVGRAVSPLACGNVVVAAPETPTAAPARDMAKMVTYFILKKVEIGFWLGCSSVSMAILLCLES